MSKQPFAEGAGEHGSRSHARLNFLGLILAAVIGATAIVWVNTRPDDFSAQKAELERQIRSQFDQQKSELERQIRALQDAKANLTPSDAEVQNKRLRKDIEDLREQAEASKKLASELKTKFDSVEHQYAELRKTRDAAAPTAEVAATTTTPVPKTIQAPPPRQRLEHFIVEVTRAQTHGESAAVYLRFTSTTSARIKMLLADGFLGSNKTFLIDDSGQHYDLDNSSGIGNCCFGFAGGDWNGGILDLAPKGTADVTLTFSRRNRAGELERHPQTFTLTAELTVGEIVKRQDWSSPQWQPSGSAGISVPGITPK